MADAVLFDTDILIDFARCRPEAINAVEKIREHSTTAISVVTQMEMIVGCRNSKELKELGLFFSDLVVIGLSRHISAKAVQLLERYRLSHGLLIPDGLIASTAIVSEIPLITKNQRDFRFVDDLDLLPYP